MIPKAMDSLDVVEMVLFVEELFETNIRDQEAESFGSPAEIVDWLELHVSNQRPGKHAIAFLKGLAEAHQNPELAEGLEQPWRREQIAAIIRQIVQ